MYQANQLAAEGGLLKEMLKRSNIFNYGEVNQFNRNSTLMSACKHIDQQQFLHYVIREKGEIYNALKTFFRKREAVG